MIKRAIETKINKLLSHFPALAILGPRQVGKTTLAKSLMALSALGKRFVYVDLENPQDFALLQEDVLFFEANMDKCIVIDEVQRMPSLFPVLRSMIDKHRVNARFILLGSASPEILAKSSETLAGRIAYTELPTLVVNELIDYDYKRHWMVGGFPEPYLINDDYIRSEWFRSFIVTYVEKEFPFIGLNTNSQQLLRFFNMLAYCSGQLLNKSNFCKSLGVSLTTINSYLSYIENAFLIRSLSPYSFNTKKRLVKSPKVYVRDSGFLHSLLGIHSYNQLLGNPIVGNSWEGYVIEQIINSLGEKYQYFYYRTHDGTECDLLICKNYEPFAIVEVKFTLTPKKTRGLTISMQDLKTKYNYIIIPEVTASYQIGENVTVCDLRFFLDNFE